MAVRPKAVALSKGEGNLAGFSFPSAMRQRPLLIASQPFLLGNVGHKPENRIGIGPCATFFIMFFSRWLSLRSSAECEFIAIKCTQLYYYEILMTFMGLENRLNRFGQYVDFLYIANLATPGYRRTFGAGHDLQLVSLQFVM
jgi:hypothetical protein